MKHSKIFVFLGGALLGTAVTVAVFSFSANKSARQTESGISETRNVFRGGFQGAQPAPADDPMPSDQKTAKPATATSSLTEVSAMPGKSAQPALDLPAPSSRPPVSSALPVAQSSHVASMSAPRQTAARQPGAGTGSSNPVPSSSGITYSSSTPMTGSFSSGATAGTETLTIGPTDVVPAALALPNPAANLTSQQQALADQMGQQFLQGVTAGAPAAGSSAQASNTASSGNTVNQQTWSQNQKLSDVMYKLYFGYQAYNVQSAAAYRQSLQNSGQ